MQLSLHRESMWLQASNTEELLADPAYERVVLAYLRRENHQEIAKSVCKQKRNGKKRKDSVIGYVHPYQGCCLQTIPPSW